MVSRDSGLNAIDPKFERYWNGDEAEENRLTGEVVSVIAEFVKTSAATRQGWHDDYERLRALTGQGKPLQGRDADRLAAYARIFKDLPQRASGWFATRDVQGPGHNRPRAGACVRQGPVRARQGL
jgi:hypothetical protein